MSHHRIEKTQLSKRKIFSTNSGHTIIALQLLLLFIISNFILPSVNGLANCPFSCECNDETLDVKCGEGHLDVLPIALNPSIQRLVIKNNKIKTIDSSIQFYAELTFLDLSNNHLVNIPSRTFAYQKKLQELHLNHNKLGEIKSRTFIELNELKVLNLRGNFLVEIGNNFFTSLIKLEELNLGQNRINKIDSNAFNGLINLRILYLDDNTLTTIPSVTFPSIHNLAELYLGINSFHTLPSGAFQNLTRLNRLDLQGAGLYNITYQSLKGLNGIRILDLSNNRLQRIPTVELSTLNRLEELYLGENDFDLVPEGAFHGLINLRRLDITGALKLKKIENGAFSTNTNLESLIIASNKELTELQDGSLSGLPRLRYIILKDNALTTLSEGLYSWNDLHTFDISENPISCDCRVLWLRNLLIEKNLTNDQVTNVLCVTPERLRDEPLKTLTPELLGCSYNNSRKQAMIGALVVGSAATITAVILMLYRCRRRIQEMLKGGWGNSALGRKEREYQKTFSDDDCLSRNSHQCLGIHSTLANYQQYYHHQQQQQQQLQQQQLQQQHHSGASIRPIPITEL